jgi:hypothetical protein
MDGSKYINPELRPLAMGYLNGICQLPPYPGTSSIQNSIEGES